MLQQGLAGFLELFEPGAVRLFVVIGSFDQGLARDVIATSNLGRVEGRIVHAPGRLVHPSSRDALHDDVEGGLERHGQVDGDEVVELIRLRSCAWKPVEEEGRGWIVGRAAEGSREGGHEAGHLVVVGGIVDLTFGTEGRGLEGHYLWPTEPSSLVQLIADETKNDAIRDQSARL